MQLASSARIPDGLLAAMRPGGEKPHQGLPSRNPGLHQGPTVCNSTTALGLQAAAVLNRVGSCSTGKERDTESGNDYFSARYYASAMGRWMSPDWSVKAEPVPYAKLENPQTLNLYAYVGNNPLIRVDIDGHKCVMHQDDKEHGHFECDNDMELTCVTMGNCNTKGIVDWHRKNGSSTPEEAAHWALTNYDPLSIQKNKEYAGKLYRDSDGNFYFTDSKPQKGASSNTGSVPSGTTEVGDWHTHGDYSIKFLWMYLRTHNPQRDCCDSDHFSPDDKSGNRDSLRIYPDYKGYLGTPSGNFLIYDPITDQEEPLP